MNANFRIVSLCPSNTEILHSLGLLPYVVGIDNYSDWPSEALQDLPRLGPDLQIDMDAVQALKPDLAVASLSVPGMENVVANLEAANIPHIVLSPHSFADIFRDMQVVADACSKVVDGEQIQAKINTLSARVERIKTATEEIRLDQRPALYWEWWPNPVFSPAAENWLTELSMLAGAQNIFAEDPGSQVKDDGSRVIACNPDYFLAVWTGVPQHKVPLAKIKHRAGWSNLASFTEGKFYVLSEGLFCRPSPRLIDGLEQLVSLLHPDIATKLNLPPVTTYAPVRTWSGAWL